MNKKRELKFWIGIMWILANAIYLLTYFVLALVLGITLPSAVAWLPATIGGIIFVLLFSLTFKKMCAVLKISELGLEKMFLSAHRLQFYGAKFLI